MVSRPLLLPILLAAALAAPATAAAQTSGGATVPPTAKSGDAGGGTTYGELPADFQRPAKRQAPSREPRAPRRRPARRDVGPALSSFGLTRPKLFLGGGPTSVRFRIDGRQRRVKVSLSVAPRGGGPAVLKLALGQRATGVTHSVPLTGKEPQALPEGAYTVRISARDRRGRGLGRSARGISARDLDVFHHRFPVAGTFSYGGADARFGAARRGHIHQGQDLTAAEGTPVVAPRGGVVKVVQYQASGAGHYVVVRGDGEDRDYVFMHLRAGSIPVAVGSRVRTGQRIGEVGSTGSSTGAHLHFEVWVGGWFERGGRPTNPLPLLRTWDSWS